MTVFSTLKTLLNPPSGIDAGRLLDIYRSIPGYVDHVHDQAEAIGGIDVFEADHCGALAVELRRSGCSPTQLARAVARLLLQDASLAPQLRLIEVLMA